MTDAEAAELVAARKRWDAARMEGYRQKDEWLKREREGLDSLWRTVIWAHAAAGVALGLFFWWLVKSSNW